MKIPLFHYIISSDSNEFGKKGIKEKKDLLNKHYGHALSFYITVYQSSSRLCFLNEALSQFNHKFIEMTSHIRFFLSHDSKRRK